MLKISKTQKIILAALCTFGISLTFELPKVQAVYESKSDKNTENFIFRYGGVGNVEN